MLCTMQKVTVFESDQTWNLPQYDYESLFSMKLIKLEAFLSMILAYDPYIGNQLAADTTWHF